MRIQDKDLRRTLVLGAVSEAAMAQSVQRAFPDSRCKLIALSQGVGLVVFCEDKSYNIALNTVPRHEKGRLWNIHSEMSDDLIYEMLEIINRYTFSSWSHTFKVPQEQENRFTLKIF